MFYSIFIGLHLVCMRPAIYNCNISMWNLLLATFQTQVSGINDVKKDRESMAKVLQEIEREKENLLKQVTQLTVEVIEANGAIIQLTNELTRANKCVEETAENQENLRVLVSEKQDMIGMLHDQVS